MSVMPFTLNGWISLTFGVITHTDKGANQKTKKHLVLGNDLFYPTVTILMSMKLLLRDKWCPMKKIKTPI